MHFHGSIQLREGKKQIRWKSDIHLISKCKFKSPSYHPHIAHLFKLWCTTGWSWLVGWTTTTQTMKKKWVANLLAAAIPHSRDSLQWWIAFLCLLLHAAGGDEFLHLTLISLELMNVSCENVADWLTESNPPCTHLQNLLLATMCQVLWSVAMRRPGDARPWFDLSSELLLLCPM